MKYLVSMIVVLILAGCAHDKPFIPDPSQQTTLKVDERLLADCPPLPEDVSIAVMEDILRTAGNQAKMYGNCRRLHKELSDVVRKIGGQK